MEYKNYDFTPGKMPFPSSTSVDDFASQIKKVVKHEVRNRRVSDASTGASHNVLLEDVARAAGFASWGRMLQALVKKNDRIFDEDMERIARAALQRLKFAAPKLAYFLAWNWCKECDIYPTEIDALHPAQIGKSPLTPALAEYLGHIFPPDLALATCEALESRYHWIEEDLIFEFES